MRKQKTKRNMMGISLLAVMGITLLSPGAGMNEVSAISTPSDAEIEVNAASVASTPSDAEIEANVEMIKAAPTAPVAIDSTAFPDDVFWEWVKENCDKDGNRQLSSDELLNCKEIWVPNKQIISLKGIELFTQLTYLNCESTEISSLDVSKNTALTSLDCRNNKISSLDLSKNTNLYIFHGYTQLVSIPMYKNGNEYYIDLSGLPLNLKRVIINEDLGENDGTVYDNTSGRINLLKAKNVGDTVEYYYETNRRIG